MMSLRCLRLSGVFILLCSPGIVPAAVSGGRADCRRLRLAIDDLRHTFGKEYPGAAEYIRRLDACEARLHDSQNPPGAGTPRGQLAVAEFVALQKEALLANPLLNFDRLLLLKRKPVGNPRRPKGNEYGLGEFLGLPRQSSWQQDTIPKRDGWENEIAVLSDLRHGGSLTRLFRPPASRLIGDLELDFDAARLLFSMPDSNLLWQVFEMDAHGGRPRQVTPGGQPGVHNFDACYLPDGGIAFASTAPLQGVPCNASVNVALAYRMDSDGKNIRQLCFDQDHNYCLTVTNDGRLLYLRWEYTGIPHVWARRLFTMNPDGTCQREFYGSGDFWPNAVFYARPVPDHPTEVVGIVTGHHVGRVGELVLFDPARGRSGASGVVQRIPGRGKAVEPVILDRLTDESWPKFLHPNPLSSKYFLVSAKPTPRDLWGIYLVDVFDNLVLIKELENYALLEPIPFCPRVRPPIIPSKVDPRNPEGLVYIEDIYAGPGLQGVPRGTVKQLRLFSYHFGYQGLAGISHRVGSDGPWEPKRVLGTLPVQPDGSVFFRVPANTPVSFQPLDAQGKALQMMRSWTTAMPGEMVSCVGCHEGQNSSPLPSPIKLALGRKPVEIEPWRGPTRGFSFRHEVQPVLDKYCVSCHDGRPSGNRPAIPDFHAEQGKFVVIQAGDPSPRAVTGANREQLLKNYAGVFDPSYIELRRFVRVGGFESDIHLLPPGEFHADTSELVQILCKGHYGVQLDDEAWDRLITWVDLNAPCHGTWHETAGVEKTMKDHLRRIELRRLYGGPVDDPEALPELPLSRIGPLRPEPPMKSIASAPVVADWPFDAAEARHRQSVDRAARRTVDLGGGVNMEFVLVPAGRFVMGGQEGESDEQPPTAVEIRRPFWIGACEVTNQQFRQFNPAHDSRYEHKGSWSFSQRHLGWMLDGSRQPVVRVSQHEALAFCAWLSEKLGSRADLPTEAQWEYACRAGSSGPFSFGSRDTDFAPFANMADATLRTLAYDTDGRFTMDLVPRDNRFDDHALVTVDVGRYLPNAWGLHDMHGNAWEWTRSIFRPYPYRDDDGRNQPAASDRCVVRGGSWNDRPMRCRSAFRLSYPAWQKVHNVGFRVVIDHSPIPR
jgi:formylglycine-generating enzyme required for sulfatase activity